MPAPKPPTTYTVELPLPPKGCSQNEHAHWRVRAGATKSYRNSCAYVYRLAKLPKFEGPVMLSLEFYNGGRKAVKVDGKRVFLNDGLYRPHDRQNATASFKAGQDALIDAGVLTKDSHRFVHQGPTTIYGTQKEHRGKCGVVLTITSLDDAAGDPGRVGDK